MNLVINTLESLRRKITSKLNGIKAKFATLTLKAESIEEKQMEKYVLKKQKLKDDIEEVENEIEKIKQQKSIIRRIA